MDEPAKSKYQDYKCPACERVIRCTAPDKKGRIVCRYCWETFKVSPEDAIDRGEEKEKERKEFSNLLGAFLLAVFLMIGFVFFLFNFEEIVKTILLLIQGGLILYFLFVIGIL